MDEGKERSVHTSRRGRVVRPFLSLATYLAILMVLLAATGHAIEAVDRRSWVMAAGVGAAGVAGIGWWTWEGLSVVLGWF